MKITVIETRTEIEASATDLRESRTLADNFSGFLSRMFRSNEPIEDEEAEEDGCDVGD